MPLNGSFDDSSESPGLAGVLTFRPNEAARKNFVKLVWKHQRRHDECNHDLPCPRKAALIVWRDPEFLEVSECCSCSAFGNSMGWL